ncbi:MAG: hypothetical protein P4N60_23510 [Verrucomicrobiae bacterium]|nr:hypothetical protein [Verrucomicrobiae bacterium]
MKTKLLLTAALVGAASLSAQAGVHFGFSFGLPLPPLPVVYVAPAAPVYVAPPACPAVVVATPACPGPDYAWVPGYWSFNGYNRVWVGGCWQHRPAYVVYGHDYDRGHDRDYGRTYDRDDHRFNDRDNGRGHDHDGYRR